MAIARNHKAGGSGAGRIDKPGEYVVSVEKTEVGKSKSGKAMLTVTFVTDDDRRIRGYYVRDLDFHMKALADCKVALGLKADTSSDQMVGKRCGIAVGEQAPNEEGRIFMTIEGYGKEADVDGYAPAIKDASDEIPF